MFLRVCFLFSLSVWYLIKWCMHIPVELYGCLQHMLSVMDIHFLNYIYQMHQLILLDIHNFIHFLRFCKKIKLADYCFVDTIIYLIKIMYFHLLGRIMDFQNWYLISTLFFRFYGSFFYIQRKMMCFPRSLRFFFPRRQFLREKPKKMHLYSNDFQVLFSELQEWLNTCSRTAIWCSWTVLKV